MSEAYSLFFYYYYIVLQGRYSWKYYLSLHALLLSANFFYLIFCSLKNIPIFKNSNLNRDADTNIGKATIRIDPAQDSLVTKAVPVNVGHIARI